MEEQMCVLLCMGLAWSRQRVEGSTVCPQGCTRQEAECIH